MQTDFVEEISDSACGPEPGNEGVVFLFFWKGGLKGDTDFFFAQFAFEPKLAFAFACIVASENGQLTSVKKIRK